MMKRKFIAPDGGWGWVIALAFALNNIVTIPIIQGFGMIYGGAFQRLGITATQSTIIININQAFGMILGMMNGPLLRRYGYRKVAVTGTLIFSMGVILTSFARSFVHFVITYGMLTSIGINMATSSNTFALNTYFKEKRGRAIGMTMTITGLGPIFLPQLISILLFNYGSEGTMLILGSISLNALVAALFLQPIKWHAKPEKMVQENYEQSEDDLKIESTNLKAQESFSLLENLNEKNRNDSEGESKKRTRKLSRTVTMASDMSDDNISVYGFEMPVSFQNGSILDLRNDDLKNEDSKGFQRKLSGGNFEPSEYKRSNSFNDAKSRKFSVSSMKYGDLELSKNIITEFLEEDEDDSKISREFDVTDKPPIEEKYPELENPIGSIVSLKVKKRKPLIIRIFRRIAKLFDLDLLRDPTYVNIMLGMSFAIFAEFNFSVLTPFILRDMNFNNDGIAMLMSTLATSDLLLRALAPYIGEWLRKSPRVMYLFSLFLLILTRTGPRGLPLIGNLLEISRLVKETGFHFGAFDKLYNLYGPVLKVRLGLGKPLIVVSGRSAILDFLGRKDFDGRLDTFEIRHRCAGKRRGIVLNDGQDWAEQKRFLQKTLKDFGFGKRTMENVVLEDAEMLCDLINEKMLDRVIDIHDFCEITAIAVISNLWNLIAGRRCDPSDDETGMLEILRILKESFRNGSTVGALWQHIPLLRFIMPKYSGFSDQEQRVSTMANYFLREVERHKKTIIHGQPRDLIDTYLDEIESRNNNNEITSFDEMQLIVLLKDLFSAGIETTSNTIGFAVAYLAKYPEVQTKIQKELDHVIGKVGNPQLIHKNSLPYLNATIAEVSRLANIAPTTIAHRAVSDCSILGYDIEKNWSVIGNLRSVHMDPEHWIEPETFKPERFIGPNGNFVEDPWLIPFGIGRRKCLGENLARISLFLFLSMLLQKFRFNLAPNETAPCLLGINGFTVAPPHIDIVITSRC